MTHWGLETLGPLELPEELRRCFKPRAMDTLLDGEAWQRILNFNFGPVQGRDWWECPVRRSKRQAPVRCGSRRRFEWLGGIDISRAAGLSACSPYFVLTMRSNVFIAARLDNDSAKSVTLLVPINSGRADPGLCDSRLRVPGPR